MSTSPTASDPDLEATASQGTNAVWTVALPDPPPLRRQGTLALHHATGLLLFKGSNRIAKDIVKPIVNAASHLLGRPQSVKLDIEAFFGDDDKREIFLDTLHGDNPNLSMGRLGVLQRHCHKLLAFADPESSTVATQRLTFRIVVAVITRYPGVRCIFHSYNDVKEASETDPPFHLLWNRPHQSCDEEWKFYRDFAIFCISQNNLTHIVEAEPPSELSRIRFKGNDARLPIEILLGHSSNGPEFHFPRLCAILYLAGILELPSFWRHLPARAVDDTEGIESAIEAGPERQIFFDVLRRLCSTVLGLINDTGVNKADTSVAPSSAMGFARYAVDLLACSTLNGVHRLHRARNLHPCPQDLPKITQDIVSAVLSYDSFLRAITLAPAITEILVSSPSTPADSQEFLFARSPSPEPGVVSRRTSHETLPPSELGVLRVTVLDAKDLWPDSKPYVTIRLGDQEVKTKPTHKTDTPVWNETFEFAAGIFTPKLYVWIHDHKTLRRDKLLCEGEIDIWRHIAPEGVSAADVYVELQGGGLLRTRLEFDADARPGATYSLRGRRPGTTDSDE